MSNTKKQPLPPTQKSPKLEDACQGGRFYAPRVYCTAGLMEFSERDRSYWIIELITKELGTRSPAYPDPRLERFQVWDFMVHEDNSGKLFGRAEKYGKPFFMQKVPLHDFGLAHFHVYALHHNDCWILHLPWEA